IFDDGDVLVVGEGRGVAQGAVVAEARMRVEHATIPEDVIAAVAARGSGWADVAAGRSRLAVLAGDDHVRLNVDLSVRVLLGIDDDDAAVWQRGRVGDVGGVPVPDA